MKKNRDPITGDPVKLSFMKKAVFSLVIILLVVVVAISAGEVLVRLLSPQAYLFPRWEYSARYGSVFPADITIISECPGRWKFVYTTNKYGCRGELPLLNQGEEKGNIVVLGDSFTFGQGVNDGEEYSAILKEALDDRFNIINIACPGWGLTQQLRLYHDIGRPYHPEAVILQYSANDLIDNYNNLVTIVDDGKLAYRDTDRTKSKLSLMISRSTLLQKSQIYCLIRNFINKDIIYRGREEREEELSQEEVPPHEKLYADLLEAFAEELNAEGIKLYIISPEDSIDWFPYLGERIKEMEADRLVVYLKTTPWFAGEDDYGSPEGHSWGRKAHRIVGENLAGIIDDRYSGLSDR